MCSKQTLDLKKCLSRSTKCTIVWAFVSWSTWFSSLASMIFNTESNGTQMKKIWCVKMVWMPMMVYVCNTGVSSMCFVTLMKSLHLLGVTDRLTNLPNEVSSRGVRRLCKFRDEHSWRKIKRNKHYSAFYSLCVLMKGMVWTNEEKKCWRGHREFSFHMRKCPLSCTLLCV